MHETKTDEEVEAESSTQDIGPYSLEVSAADGFQGLVLTEISIDKMQIRQNQLVYNGKQSNTVTSFDAAYAIVALSIYQRSRDALPVGYASADGGITNLNTAQGKPALELINQQASFLSKQAKTSNGLIADNVIIGKAVHGKTSLATQFATIRGLIAADGYREERFSLPNNTVYPVTVKTRLLYRIFPQWVTDAVQVGQPDLPTPPIVELMSLESQFSP